MNTKRVVVKILGGKEYDVFSCPSNDYQGMIQVSVDEKSPNAAVVSAYHEAYTNKQKGTSITVQPGTSTVVLASRVLLGVGEIKGHAIASFETIGVFPKISG